jgi:hypothetical protein
MEEEMLYVKVLVSFYPVPRTFNINTGCLDWSVKIGKWAWDLILVDYNESAE